MYHSVIYYRYNGNVEYLSKDCKSIRKAHKWVKKQKRLFKMLKHFKIEMIEIRYTCMY